VALLSRKVDRGRRVAVVVNDSVAGQQCPNTVHYDTDAARLCGGARALSDQEALPVGTDAGEPVGRTEARHNAFSLNSEAPIAVG
jgi:hypothetical protein